jgi:hypothetical protein
MRQLMHTLQHHEGRPSQDEQNVVQHLSMLALTDGTLTMMNGMWHSIRGRRLYLDARPLNKTNGMGHMVMLNPEFIVGESHYVIKSHV